MMPNQKLSYRITNWSEYNKSLKQRGSLTIWLSEDFEENWLVVNQDKKGRKRPFLYSETCMKLMLSLKHLFKLALRQLTGITESLFTLLGKTLPIPEFSRLSKRMKTSLPSLQLPSLERKTVT